MAKLLALLILIGISLPSTAQVKNDEILLNIGGKPITVGEFMAVYQKNDMKKGEPVDQKKLEEYLQLYINFKLKVREAEELGLDTVTTFVNELKGYRDQLAKPYFSDEATIERLTKEAWDREHFDLRTRHIFIKLAPDALPDDTLQAWQKISKIRERVMNGESFEKVATEASEDPSARDREATQQHPFLPGNHGDLGYFTVFDYVYPFENGAYRTEAGKVSPIVRTEYGYHIIKVTSRHDALGKITAAHLYMSIPKNAKHEDSLRVAQRIDSVYQLLKGGEKWDDLVKKYSDDKGSAGKGGTLPPFGVNRMVPEFIDAIYALQKPGDYSAPVKTPYGWHIIRLVERKTPGKFEDEKADLKQKVQKDGRSEIAKQTVLSNIRKEAGFTENPDAKKDFYTVVTDSIFNGKWDPALAQNLSKPMFTVGDTRYTQKDFTAYLQKNQRKTEKQKIIFFIDRAYKDFVTEGLIKWENARLESKYPDFRNLMGEYRDGILLFDLTDQKVWSKAVKDTTGLKEYYENNKKNYMWDERMDATIYTVRDQKYAQKVRNFIISGLTDDAILKEINTDTAKILKIESGKYSRKENPYIDAITWAPGLSGELKANTGAVIVNVRKIIPPEVKTLNEARGLITNDYQNYLEKIWVEYLHRKFTVIVNKEVLARIK
ncbi:MAG: peptidylprolyl isomerase [Bacteroidetes bacterium]|nr:peptidylprolyl isomerase [Bacteroidota bacterium]